MERRTIRRYKRKGRRRAAPVAIPNVFSEAAYHTAERAVESAAFAEQNLADFSTAF